MNMVPLSPITMVRPPGCPDDQISALKPAGSLILSSGILSTGVASGETGCGLGFGSGGLERTLVLSTWLKRGGAGAAPSGEAAGGVGCWAQPALAAINTAMLAAGKASR